MNARNATEFIARLIADPIENYPIATVACFDPTEGELPRRRISQPLLAEFLARLSKAGAPAVLIGASTGHGHLRTPEELSAWFAAAAACDCGGMMLTALLRPEDGVEFNRRTARQLAELGYAAAYVRPGTDLPRSADSAAVAENMRPAVEAIAAAGLAVGLYSIPDVSGVRMTPQAAIALAQSSAGSQIVAVKVTEANYEESTLRFLQEPGLARMKIVQGWDLHLAAALRDGPRFDAAGRARCGVTSGPMSFAVHQYIHLLSCAERGDWDTMSTAQAAVSTLFRAMQDDPAKFADLQRAKYVMGLGEPLTSAVDSQSVERLLAALESIASSDDRRRLARSLDLMGSGPFHERLARIAEA